MKELSVWKISDKLFTKSEKDIKKLLKRIRKEIGDDISYCHIEEVFDKYLKKNKLKNYHE